MVVDLTPWTRLTAVYARLAAPVAIGFDPPGQHRGTAFDIAVRHRCDAHELDNHAELAAQFDSRPYRMNVITERFDAPDDLDFRRLILCHASAGGSRAADKAWPIGNWAELTLRLAAEGWQVGFTGAAADTPSIERILAKAALPSRQVFLFAERHLWLSSATCYNARDCLSQSTRAYCMWRLRLMQRYSRYTDRLTQAAGGAVNLNSIHPAAGYILYGYESHPRGHDTMLAHTVEGVAGAAFAKLV